MVRDPSLLPPNQRAELNYMQAAAYVCDEFGREYEDADCSSFPCGADTIVVEVLQDVGSPDERKGWVCRGCGSGDVEQLSGGRVTREASPCATVGGGKGGVVQIQIEEGNTLV